MINKKTLVLVITILMSFTLTGCISSNSYSHDYNKVSEISTTILYISDAYYNSDGKKRIKEDSKRFKEN